MPPAIPQDFEDRVARVLCPLLQAHDVLLDLHSFHTAGAPFVMVGPHDNTGDLEPFAHAQAEVALAAALGPALLVEGWLETYARGVERRRAVAAALGRPAPDPQFGVGTTEYIRACGGYGVTLECGQHDDPRAPEVARLAVLRTLRLLDMLEAPEGAADAPLVLQRDEIAAAARRIHPTRSTSIDGVYLHGDDSFDEALLLSVPCVSQCCCSAYSRCSALC